MALKRGRSEAAVTMACPKIEYERSRERYRRCLQALDGLDAEGRLAGILRIGDSLAAKSSATWLSSPQNPLRADVERSG